MEEQPVVNFKQFRSNKSNKSFLVRFSIYIVLLSTLAAILYSKFSSQTNKKNKEPEIRGVRIEIPES